MLSYPTPTPESVEATSELVSVLKDSLTAGCGEDVSKVEVLDTVAALARRGKAEAAHTAIDHLHSSHTAPSLR